MNKKELINAYCKDKTRTNMFIPGYGINAKGNYFQLRYFNFPYTHAEPTFLKNRVDNYIDGENIYEKSKNPIKLQNEIDNYCKTNNLKCNLTWMNGFRIVLKTISTLNRKPNAVWYDCKNEYIKHILSVNDIVSNNL